MHMIGKDSCHIQIIQTSPCHHLGLVNCSTFLLMSKLCLIH